MKNIKDFNSFVNENKQMELDFPKTKGIAIMREILDQDFFKQNAKNDAHQDLILNWNNNYPGYFTINQLLVKDPVKLQDDIVNYLKDHHNINARATMHKPSLKDDWEIPAIFINDRDDRISLRESVNEGYNLFTLQARADHMDDLYVTVDGKGDEIFKVTSVDIEGGGEDIHAGSLNVVSEETGEEMIIDHDEIASTLVGDQYHGHNKKESGMRHD